MALHNRLGAAGEAFACRYLEENGYRILHRNWRFGHKELDIVALDGDRLAFVEVKTRTDDRNQNPRDAVDDVKIAFLVDATEAYIARFDRPEEVRFDILTLVGAEGSFAVELIREAFHA